MRVRRPHLKAVADALVSVALLVAALTVIYRNVANPTTMAAPEVPPEPLSLDGAMIRGSDDAEAVMIVFADFQCPYCARFAREVQPEIERRYVDEGRLAIAFQHLPLPIHPQAVHAAVMAECAGRQGKFWEAHDRMFAETKLDEEALRAMPESIGLDQRLLDACVLEPSTSERVTASAAKARALGVRSTPSFFLGTRLADGRVEVRRVLSGALPLDEFVRDLDATLGSGDPFWQRWARRITS
jgi:protein-disulfide isomerase